MENEIFCSRNTAISDVFMKGCAIESSGLLLHITVVIVLYLWDAYCASVSSVCMENTGAHLPTWQINTGIG